MSVESEIAMRHVATFFAAISLLIAGAALAQPGDVIDYTPVPCMHGGDSAMLQLSVSGKGELRAYFRHINSTEWCSVEGQNEGKLSTVVMPKFETGDEIEYFFVLLDGKKVIAKSPEIYRSKNTSGCETTSALPSQGAAKSASATKCPRSVSTGRFSSGLAPARIIAPFTPARSSPSSRTSSRSTRPARERFAFSLTAPSLRLS